MKLRPAIFDDWRSLLLWRNDPVARENSFQQDIIDEDSHKNWFANSLGNDRREILILEDDKGTAVGTIRCDDDDGNKILSWNICPTTRGKGYGKILLGRFFENRTGQFVAEIKPTNIPSIKMAKRFGFVRVDEHDNKYTVKL